MKDKSAGCSKDKFNILMHVLEITIITSNNDTHNDDIDDNKTPIELTLELQKAVGEA